MATKAVQLSLDTELLDKIDSDPEAQERGRSAFVRAAVRFYMSARERRGIDASIAQAYAGESDAMADEVADFIETQRWPERDEGGFLVRKPSVPLRVTVTSSSEGAEATIVV